MKFDLPSYSTYSFSDFIYINCPECGELASVKTELPRYTTPFPLGTKSSCYCKNCGYLKKTGEEWKGKWVGTVSSRCDFCGTNFSFTTGPEDKVFNTINNKCQACGRFDEYDLRWCKVHGNAAQDPFFGLELFLQTDVKGNQLWFYNESHMDYIKKYVSATQRDGFARPKYSIVANLPKWVKGGKNREIILKKIEKLETGLQKAIAKTD